MVGLFSNRLYLRLLLILVFGFTYGYVSTILHFLKSTKFILLCGSIINVNQRILKVISVYYKNENNKVKKTGEIK